MPNKRLNVPLLSDCAGCVLRQSAFFSVELKVIQSTNENKSFCLTVQLCTASGSKISCWHSIVEQQIKQKICCTTDHSCRIKCRKICKVSLCLRVIVSRAADALRDQKLVISLLDRGTVLNEPSPSDFSFYTSRLLMNDCEREKAN